MYSGHKQFHCLKFQSVTAPNGLIAHMYGPIAGRHHDAFMLSVSGLQRKLATITRQDGSPCVIYGDPVYGVSSTILAPYRGSQLTRFQQSNESGASECGMDIWQNRDKLLLLGLQEKQQSTFATRWKVLLSGCYLDELSYMFVWVTNIHLLRSGSTSA